MSKKEVLKLETKIEKLPDKKIYINVNHLEKGDYELNIINKNKLIVTTNFKKR
jgi:CRISPR/Cas system-associated protein Cas5 (RAMP superfamily)